MARYKSPSSKVAGRTGWFAMVLLCFALSWHAHAAISVESALEESAPEGAVIAFRLTNDSSRTVKIARGLAPWSGTAWNGFLLLAVEGGATQKQLRMIYPIVDPVGSFEIGPRESIRGTLRLSTLIPSIDSALRRGDVILFWSYHPLKSDEIEITSNGGWFLLKQQREKQ